MCDGRNPYAGGGGEGTIAWGCPVCAYRNVEGAAACAMCSTRLAVRGRGRAQRARPLLRAAQLPLASPEAAAADAAAAARFAWSELHSAHGAGAAAVAAHGGARGMEATWGSSAHAPPRRVALGSSTRGPWVPTRGAPATPGPARGGGGGGGGMSALAMLDFGSTMRGPGPVASGMRGASSVGWRGGPSRGSDRPESAWGAGVGGGWIGAPSRSMAPRRELGAAAAEFWEAAARPSSRRGHSAGPASPFRH